MVLGVLIPETLQQRCSTPLPKDNLESEAIAGLLPEPGITSMDTWQESTGENTNVHKAERAVTRFRTKINASKKATVVLEVSALRPRSQA